MILERVRILIPSLGFSGWLKSAFVFGLVILMAVGVTVSPQSEARATTAKLTPYTDTPLSLGDDAESQQSITDVFPNGVKFGGTVYTSIYVVSNGYITFGGGQRGYSPTGIQAYTADTPIIAAQYDDLDPTKGGNIYFEADSANKRVVVTWDAVAPYNTPVGAGNAAAGTSFQIVLTKPDSYDADNLDFGIEIRYQDIGWAKAAINSKYPSAGWSTGTSSPVYQELPRSGSSSFIATEDESNVGESGVYRWAVSGGVIPSAPTVSTTAAASVGPTSATLGGDVKSDGEATVTSRGIVLSTSANPTKDGAGVTTLTASSGGTGVFTESATGLSASTKYYFRAWAENSNGVGYGREAEFTTDTIGSPTVPQNFSVVPADESISLTFSAPSSDGGAAIEAYQYSLNSGAWVGVGSSPGTFSVSGLTNGTQYSVRVRANNNTENGTAATAVTVIAGAPLAPTISGVTAGNTKLTVAFTAPSSNGGSAITDYEYSTDNGSTWTSSGQTSSPITITGLTNGDSYQVKLRAKSSRAGLASSASTGTPASTVSNAPAISSIATSAGTLSVAFVAPSDDGGSAITGYKYSTDGTNYQLISQTNSPLLITTLSSDGTTALTDGTAYSVTLKAVNGNGDSVASSAITATPGAPASSDDDDDDDSPAPVVSPSAGGGTPALLPRRAVTPPQANLPVTRQGPVLRNGVVPRDVRAPEVRIGGQATSVQSRVTDPSNLSVRAGVVSLGVQVQQDEGSVFESDDGTTEIAVRKGAKTTLSGEGLRPESTVQVFLPLQGGNAKELTRIPVGPDGSFSGDAVFATQPDDDPLPVGRQVLQLVSVDADGNEVVVDMTVNIAQPPPAPELNRVEGVIPTLTPGSSIATNAGVPEQVRVSAVEEQKLAVVEGDGWSMAIGVAAEDGAVQATDGGASLTLVRNETARVSGDGFMPGTRADVWLFSEPTLLGTVTIDDEGRFDGEVNIDGRVIAVGNHTLQLQGVGEDGYVRAANMGVTVGDPAEVVPTAEENSLMFIWWVLAALVLMALVIVLWVAANRRRQA